MSAAKLFLHGGVVVDEIEDPLPGKRMNGETIKVAVTTDYGNGKSTRHSESRCRGDGIVNRDERNVRGNLPTLAGEGYEAKGALFGKSLEAFLEPGQLPESMVTG